MKRSAVFIGFFLAIGTALSASEKENSLWYPFVPAGEMDSSSPANAGAQILDAPAGKHGFVKVKERDFVFEDGTPARFWGTNLGSFATFPKKDRAAGLAGKLAFFGFNAARIHHLDLYDEPGGIFRKRRFYESPKSKKTRELSAVQLDRLDYLVHQLKSRGLYINMNLLVSRQFTPADGVADAGALGMAAKPVSMFDPRLIELQKEYAKKLLTHFNKYTGLRYCDDPAMALVEITNENSIFQHWRYDNLNGPLLGLKRGSIPDPYVKELDALWNEWLERKYGSVEALKKAWAGQARAGDSPAAMLPPARWTLEALEGAEGRVENENDAAKISVLKSTGTDWHLQYRCQIPLKRGNYVLKFSAGAEKDTVAAIACQQSVEPWKMLGLAEKIPIPSAGAEYEVPFTVPRDEPQAKIAFLLGGAQNVFTIKNASLEPAQTADFDANAPVFDFGRPLHKLLAFYPPRCREDIRDFYIDLERNYLREMTDFLKKEAGVKVPIVGIGGYVEPEDLEAQSECDFLDAHSYWDHPGFPRGWNMNDFRMHGRSMLLDKNLGLIGDVLRVPEGKPLTVSEWNHCHPNPFAYETPVLLAAKAVEKGWDGLFQFAFAPGSEYKPPFDRINSFFHIAANPQQLLLCSLGSFIFFDAPDAALDLKDGFYELRAGGVAGAAGFIKNKQFKFEGFEFTAGRDGAVFIRSAENKPLKESSRWILTAVAQVKDDGSGWKDEKYDWGQAPVMLEKMNAEIRLAPGKKYRVFELSENGSKGKQVPVSERDGFQTFSTDDSSSPWFEVVAG